MTPFLKGTLRVREGEGAARGPLWGVWGARSGWEATAGCGDQSPWATQTPGRGWPHPGTWGAGLVASDITMATQAMSSQEGHGWGTWGYTWRCTAGNRAQSPLVNTNCNFRGPQTAPSGPVILQKGLAGLWLCRPPWPRRSTWAPLPPGSNTGPLGGLHMCQPQCPGPLPQCPRATLWTKTGLWRELPVPLGKAKFPPVTPQPSGRVCSSPSTTVGCHACSSMGHDVEY